MKNTYQETNFKQNNLPAPIIGRFTIGVHNGFLSANTHDCGYQLADSGQNLECKYLPSGL